MNFTLLNNETFWPIVIDNKYKVGYIPIPKVANTSILNGMLAWKTDDELKKRIDKIAKEKIHIPTDNPARVHFYQKELFDLTIPKSNDSSDLFVFSFVRHPVKRFISFYRDKILRWDKNIETKLHEQGFYHKMPLQECINNLLKCDPLTLEQHLRPLVCFLYHNGKLIPDCIFKVEDVKKGWDFISEYVGTTVSLKSENSSDNQKVDKISLNSFQENEIKKYYKLDMELFNYD